MPLTSAQRRAVAILPKPFASLSFLGSLYIVADFLRKPQRRKAAYHRIVFAMSVIDMFTSAAYFLSTWPMPVGSGAPLAGGNDRTCAAQAFVLQFGMSIPLYNAALAMYYYLVTRSKSKRSDRALRTAEPLMHAVPLGAGLGTAVAGLALDLYGPALSWCWIDLEHQWFRMYLFYIPLLCSLVSAVTFVVMLYCTVRGQEIKSSQWRGHQSSEGTRSAAGGPSRGAGGQRQKSVFRSVVAGKSRDERARESSLSRQCAIQGFWYTAAFLYTWIFAASSRINQLFHHSHPPFGLVVMFMLSMPCQGFFNFLVYNRTRYLAYWKNHPDGSCLGLVKRVLGTFILAPYARSEGAVDGGKEDSAQEAVMDPSERLSTLRRSRWDSEETEQISARRILEQAHDNDGSGELDPERGDGVSSMPVIRENVHIDEEGGSWGSPEGESAVATNAFDDEWDDNGCAPPAN